jgi:hypothetical protein
VPNPASETLGRPFESVGLLVYRPQADSVLANDIGVFFGPKPSKWKKGPRKTRRKESAPMGCRMFLQLKARTLILQSHGIGVPHEFLVTFHRSDPCVCGQFCHRYGVCVCGTTKHRHQTVSLFAFHARAMVRQKCRGASRPLRRPPAPLPPERLIGPTSSAGVGLNLAFSLAAPFSPPQRPMARRTW